LQNYDLPVTDSFEDMQRKDRLIGSQGKLVGSVLTDLEAALVLQGLDDLVQKASAEVASSKVDAACSHTFYQRQDMTCMYMYSQWVNLVLNSSFWHYRSILHM